MHSVGSSLIAVFVVAWLNVGCAPPRKRPPDHPVRSRAPFDLDCPQQEIRYKRLDQDTVGVVGCGHRATYVKVCRQKLDETGTMILGTPVVDDECKWRMNNATR